MFPCLQLYTILKSFVKKIFFLYKTVTTFSPNYDMLEDVDVIVFNLTINQM